MTTNAENTEIHAAGGLMWRECTAGCELVIVRRKGGCDWTLPKGKLNANEAWKTAALRKIREETGHHASILGYAGATSYLVGGGTKIVRFWHMVTMRDAPLDVDPEKVGEVRWLTVDAALILLSHPVERALLEASRRPAPWFVQPKAASKRQRRCFRPITLKRLENTVDIVEAELDIVIDQVNRRNICAPGWQRQSKQLLADARQAMTEGNAELGWRRLKAADRFRLYGLGADQLSVEAAAILAEASDDEKDLSKWRRTSVRALLGDDGGKLKQSLGPERVVHAKRIIDEHQDNVYQKMNIVTNRLNLLSVVSLVALIAWLTYPPFAPYGSLLAPPVAGDEHGWSSRLAWCGVTLAGVLGALFSGFSSSMTADRTKARIPAELTSSTVAVARISMAVVTSLAVSIFMASGMLSILNPTYEAMLAVAFASGFSDRLLLNALKTMK